MGTRTLQQFQDGMMPFVGGNDVGNDWITRQINSAYDEIIGAIEFAGVLADHSFNTSDGTASYSLPTDFMGMQAVTDGTSDIRLLRLEYKDYYAKNPDSDVEAKPTHWARDGSCVYLWPTPDDTYAIKLVYYGEPTHLSTSSDVTVLTQTWDQAIHLLAAHYILTDLGTTEAEIARAQLYFQRAMSYIGSRKTDRDWDRQTIARGLEVAWSEADLTDQAT